LFILTNNYYFKNPFIAYPTSNSYPRQQQQQSVYPQLPGNQTTVVVQPSPAYVGGGGRGYGGYGGYNRGIGGSSLASAGLGFAGGALLGGKILRDI